jgi:hypothetical protein
MFRKLIILFLLVYSASTSAQSFEYVTDRNDKSPSLLALAEIQQVMEDSGFWPVDLRNTGRLDILGVDQIFINADLSSQVFVKQGLWPSLDKIPKEIKLAEGWVSHFKSRDGVSYAVFFRNVNSETRYQIQKAFIRISSHQAKLNRFNLLNSFFLNKAWAAPATCQRGPDEIMGLKSSLEQILSFQFLSTCVLTAVNAAGSTVSGPIEGFKKLLSNPENFWKQAGEEFENLKKFVLHLKSEFKMLGEAFRHLDPKTIGTIGCSIIGEAVASAMIGIATGGVAALGTVKVFARISLLVSKLASNALLLSKLNSLHLRGVLRSENLINGVVSCAIR